MQILPGNEYGACKTSKYHGIQLNVYLLSLEHFQNTLLSFSPFFALVISWHLFMYLNSLMSLLLVDSDRNTREQIASKVCDPSLLPHFTLPFALCAHALGLC